LESIEVDMEDGDTVCTDLPDVVEKIAVKV